MKIREMREVGQRPQRANDGFYTRHVVRFFSIYVTRVFMAAGLSANAVTGLMAAVGACGVLLLGAAGPAHRLAGAVVMQLWFLLDCCDGEVARLRGSSSLTGLYIDYLSHYVIHPCMIFFVGAGLYRASSDGSILFIAFSATLAVLLAELAQDCCYKAVYFGMTKAGSPAGERGTGHAEQAAGGSFPRAIVRGAAGFFVSIYFIFKVPAVMNLLCIAVLLDWLGPWPSIFWEKIFLWFVGTVGHLHWIAFSALTIYYRQTERSYSIMEQKGKQDAAGNRPK